MKKKMTLALASSMFMLALAAAPHRAQAASNSFINFGDSGGEDSGQHTTPPQHGPLVSAILAFFGVD